MSEIHLFIDFVVPLKYWVDNLIVYEYKVVRCLVYGKVGKYYFLSRSKRQENQLFLKYFDCNL